MGNEERDTLRYFRHADFVLQGNMNDKARSPLTEPMTGARKIGRGRPVVRTHTTGSKVTKRCSFN